MQRKIHFSWLLGGGGKLAGNRVALVKHTFKRPFPACHATKAKILLLNGFEQVRNHIDLVEKLLEKVIRKINQRDAQDKERKKFQVERLLWKKPQQQIGNNAPQRGQTAQY